MSASRVARLFFAFAALVVLARSACAIVGLEDYVTVVCGANTTSAPAQVLGLAFVVIHLLFVVVAPIFALAAGLIAACVPVARIPRRGRAGPP
jgi:hypothetical protein